MGVETLLYVGAAAMGVGKAVEITEQRKAADAADRASQDRLAMEREAVNTQERVKQEELTFQRNKYAEEKRMADITNIRSMRQSIRAARLASATMVNTGANKGGMGGSAVAGATSSIAAQSAGNINFMMEQAQSNATINSSMLASASRIGDIRREGNAVQLGYGQSIADLEAYGRQSSLNATTVGGTLTGIGSTIFAAGGGPGAVAGGIDSIFSGVQNKIIPKSPYW